MAHGAQLSVMWEPGWGGGVEGEWIHAYIWLRPLLFTCNYHNIVNPLYPKTKKKKKNNLVIKNGLNLETLKAAPIV